MDWSATGPGQKAADTDQLSSVNVDSQPVITSESNTAVSTCVQKPLPPYTQVDDFLKFLTTQMGDQDNFMDPLLCPAGVSDKQTSTSKDTSLNPDFGDFPTLDMDQASSFSPTELGLSDVMTLDPHDLTTYLNEQYACVPTGLLTPSASSRPDQSAAGLCPREESTTDSSGCLMSEYAMAKNKHVVDSIINILVCHHSIDERLLTILSLIACRVIAWYAAVARDESTRSAIAGHLRSLLCSRSTDLKDKLSDQVRALSLEIGNVHAGENDQRSTAVQSVLGEAHRVQKLADLLTNRLENIRLHKDLASMVEQGRVTNDDAALGQPDADTLAPSVIHMFDTLEAGLRGRIDTAASQINLRDAQDQYQQMAWNEQP